MRNDARKMPSPSFYAWRKVGAGLPQSDACAWFRLVWLIAHRPQPPRDLGASCPGLPTGLPIGAVGLGDPSSGLYASDGSRVCNVLCFYRFAVCSGWFELLIPCGFVAGPVLVGICTAPVVQCPCPGPVQVWMGGMDLGDSTRLQIMILGLRFASPGVRWSADSTPDEDVLGEFDFDY